MSTEQEQVPPSTDPKEPAPATPAEEPPSPTPLETAREALIRCSRSQQLSVPDLVLLLDVVDAAIASQAAKGGDPKSGGDTKSSAPTKTIKDAQGKERPVTINDIKLTSEGAPVVQLQSGETLVDPNAPPAGSSSETPPSAETASTEPSGENGEKSSRRRHR